jgi:hypothetical protein
MQDCIHSCNCLLREEVAMVQTYAKAIRLARSNAVADGLFKVQAAHERAVDLLRTRLLDVGGVSWEGDCNWGEITEETVAFHEDPSLDLSLDALQQREEQGLERYTLVLENGAEAQGCKALIRAELLPLTRRSIDVLRMLAAVDRHSMSPFAVAHAGVGFGV